MYVSLYYVNKTSYLFSYELIDWMTSDLSHKHAIKIICILSNFRKYLFVTVGKKSP